MSITITLIIVIYYNEVKQQIHNSREYQKIQAKNGNIARQIVKNRRYYL